MCLATRIPRDDRHYRLRLSSMSSILAVSPFVRLVENGRLLSERLVMENPQNLDAAQQWVTRILAYLGGYGGLAALLYLLLKKTLEKTIDSRFDERLEKVKHDLQLEQQKMSVVYENQKDSFRKILVAAHKGIEAIEDRISGEDDWQPISQKDVDAFSRVFAEETLFMDDDSDQAVRLFREIMSTAVPYQTEVPTNYEVWRAYNQMSFIAERLAEHFRIRVGLTKNATDPLLDVKLLEACCLINRHHFATHDLPTKSIFRFKDGQTVAPYVSAARQNPALLKAELMRLKNATEKDPFFFETFTRTERCLRKVESL
jgi:hypothetical protein